MAFRNSAASLIEKKKFDELETLWMAQLEADPGAVESFLVVAKALRKAEQRSQSDTLLGLLGDVLKEKGWWVERLHVLKEVARISKTPAHYRQQIEEALKKAYGAKPSFKRIFEAAKFSDPASNPAERADKIESWLAYEVGEPFFMAGRGAGVVIELNVDLGVCRLDFERDKRVPVPLGAAARNLIPLPEGHVLREKFTNTEAVKKEAKASPPNFFARILQSFARPMQMGEVRDALIGITPEDKWSSWWTAARKNPQIVVSGTGAKATYSWSASAGDAEKTVKRDFDKGDLKTKLDLARKHSARSPEIADHFATVLASEAERLSKTDISSAWQILATLETLPGNYTTHIDHADLLTGPMASRVIASVNDKALREKAFKAIRERHPEWQKVYSEAFFLDDDPKLLTMMMQALEQDGSIELRDRLIDETVRYPRRHPRAFYWYLKTLDEMEGLSPRATYGLLFQILDALTHDEFSVVRARLREFFDKGALAIRIIMGRDDEEQGRKLLETIDRYGALEEYRREIVKHATIMKYPALREAQQEPVYATAESLEQKRAEMHNLKNVEIPANSKALQAAREMGDLRENFEYKAARSRAEYLSARVGELAGEISRVRVLEPTQVDTTEVRVGTKVALSNGELKRDVTILGPWESSPETGVYSNQSDVAKALLGHAVGDIVSFMGNDYVIDSIRKWHE